VDSRERLLRASRWGSVTLVLSERTLQRILLPLVAFAAGSLLGGAFFHMIPVGLASGMSEVAVYALILAGFTVFFGLEQFLHWHHCHRAETECKKPLTYLILIGDGLHNFLGGLAVAGTFLIDIRLGIVTWLAAAALEVPQELGDFGVLVHGGWERRQRCLQRAVGTTFWSAVSSPTGVVPPRRRSWSVRRRQLHLHGAQSDP
jgi:zinc and cadmium transporter